MRRSSAILHLLLVVLFTSLLIVSVSGQRRKSRQSNGKANVDEYRCFRLKPRGSFMQKEGFWFDVMTSAEPNPQCSARAWQANSDIEQVFMSLNYSTGAPIVNRGFSHKINDDRSLLVTKYGPTPISISTTVFAGDYQWGCIGHIDCQTRQPYRITGWISCRNPDPDPRQINWIKVLMEDQVPGLNLKPVKHYPACNYRALF